MVVGCGHSADDGSGEGVSGYSLEFFCCFDTIHGVHDFAGTNCLQVVAVTDGLVAFLAE